MYIYNVTVNIEEAIQEDWLQWMKESHIPDVMETGLFKACRMLQVMADSDTGLTYSIQYTVKDMESLKLYQQMYAAKLQAESAQRYGDRALAFRTILRVEHDHG